MTKKQKILIADDSEMNRAILADMLGEDYEIIEAENGVQAVALIQRYRTELSLVLLDIVMPEMDGFGVLQTMNDQQLIEDIPVIMISAENSSSHIERAYKLGITEFISRPFDILVVHHRVVNTILLYAKQKNLTGLIADQFYEKERQSKMMIDILSHIVEFRNGESGQHVSNVNILTGLILEKLVETSPEYRLTPAEISRICTVSALHDVGKIAIDEKILNKPGKLTDEEFAVMKTHTVIGAKMMDDLVSRYQNEPLVQMARDICRWHHERYDGRGYPDGLKGDDIPIAAQVVALADVYDALTSERVYKKAIPHEEAVQMIIDGKCGAFNPKLLACFTGVAGSIPESLAHGAQLQTQQTIVSLYGQEGLEASGRTLQLLEYEREKYRFFADMTDEILFEYTASPPMIVLPSLGAKLTGFDEFIVNPKSDKKITETLGVQNWEAMSRALRSTTPQQPNASIKCQIKINGEERWMRIVARSTWSSEEPPQYTGAIGRVMDIHDSMVEMEELKVIAYHDMLTGLLNSFRAKEEIVSQIEMSPESQYALAIFDCDYFKRANDSFGHSFGNELLVYIAQKLKKSIRKGDIAARVGGDEFLVFLEYKGELEPIIKRIFSSLLGKYESFALSVSMGVAKSDVVGADYEKLFHAADQALYNVKRGGRGRYCFYDESMNEMFSAVSPIEGAGPGQDDEENKKENTK